jgi:hypothetical protein
MYHFTMFQSISKKGTSALLTFKGKKIAYTAIVLLISLLSFTSQTAKAQTAGDYRSIINGGLPATVFWGDASTWERYDGAVWAAALVAPDFNDGVITVRSPTYVRINGDLTIDQTIIENGATIQPNSAGATLTINNGVGTDLELNSFSATVWANNHLLNVTSGALIEGLSSSMQYRGLTVINNGTINATFNPRPDVASTTISGVGTIYILKTANNGNCFLAGNQTITNALQFDFGNLITGANKIILTSNAIVQNLTLTNYYVNGNLEMQCATGNSTKNFLVGDAGGYAPVMLTLTGASTTGSVTVSTTNTDHPNIGTSNFIANKTVNRYWSVVNNGMVFTNASTTFTWPAADADAGTTPANFKVGRFNGGSWTYPLTTFQNSTTVSATPVALGDFSDKINIAHVYPKIGHGDDVRNMIKKLKKTWTVDGSTVAVYTANSSGEAQYTLVTRYKQGLKEKASGFRKPFKETYEAVNGAGSYAQYLKDAAEFVNENWSELLFLRKDLSSK